MADEVEQIVRETRDKVMELHTTLLGRGGVVDRVEVLEDKAEKHGVFVTKVTTVVGILGAGVGVLGAWMKDWISGK